VKIKNERLEAASDVAFPSKEHYTPGIILSGLTTRKMIEEFPHIKIKLKKLIHFNFSLFSVVMAEKTDMSDTVQLAAFNNGRGMGLITCLRASDGCFSRCSFT